ncbi:4-hydroxy-tetrahydrodipicolinate synthase [Salsuginibacillus kocurii]|uniref:4-hydroxy-tetrahydrodipicolinate synthase n=1 Tax=Salsuginibacillus kocurii TaxID=427078 RepID=UPI00036ED3B0|nr:4-hydroxy-tetrahydrodipicolinate synthase [Salsuginibacillus kocurii]
MNEKRLFTAMVTPFTEIGEIDFDRLPKLVDHLIETGSEAFVIAGTTGEAPTLSLDEKIELAKAVVRHTNGRVPIYAGTGTNATAGSVSATKELEKTGVDGIMAVTPYYNKPSQEGMFEHFKAIAASTSLPVMIYNIPGRCVVNLLPDTIIELASIENITSVKEASGNLENCAHIIAHTGEDFKVYSGDDSMTLPLLSIGGDGVVSVAAHLIGTKMEQMIDSFFKGEVQRAAQLHRECLPAMQACFSAPNPSAVKGVMKVRGIIEASTRLPLLPMPIEKAQALDNIFPSV